MPRQREVSVLSAEEQPPVLSGLVRGEGQNAGRLHTILPKELSQGWSRLIGEMCKEHKLCEIRYRTVHRRAHVPAS